ncbi:MAG: ABC transporter substrate-binding protein, partial [Lachnospiraceae bacterium]|nr:ABC transporter substrate-binding protein [Lachnospiraceae bacterium]
MTRKRYQQILSKVLAVSMTFSMLFGSGVASPVYAKENTSQAAPAVTTTGSAAAGEVFSIERLTSNYSIISKNYTAGNYNGERVELKMDKVLDSNDKSYLAKDNYEYGNGVIDVSSGDVVHLTVVVPETALYRIGFDYLSYDESILPIEFALKVDGEYPFYELRNLTFETTWSQADEPSLDRYGNEIVSLPTKLIQWENKFLSDTSYRYAEPFSIELKAGKHEFEIEVSEGNFLLGNIYLEAPAKVPEYTGSQAAPGKELITIQGEDFYLRNSSSIHAIGEYNTALKPISVKETVLNTVDGDSFKTAGQTITWQFNVEKAGYYYIGMNYRQSTKSDFPVFVDVRIDGEIPNTEFQSVYADYTTKYKTTTLKDDEGKKLSVYLDEGEHTVSYTLSIDNLRYVLEQVDIIMNGINDLSLEVTKVAGTNKDK